MKISARQVDPFIKNPDKAVRVVLIYGPEEGLMRERAKALGLTIVTDLNDPFNAATLSAGQIGEDPARLNDEAMAQSMMGGGRLIRITDGADKLTVHIKSYLQNPSPDNLVIIEGGDLGPRSSLRKLCEKETNAAALPCYMEGERELGNFIRETLHAQNIQIAPDALTWLSATLVGDRQRAMRELEKLVIYAGAGAQQITLDDAQACCGTAGDRSLDELVSAIGAGQTDKTLTIYKQMLEEGIAVIAMLRTLQNHYRRLHQAQAHVRSGKSADMAMKSLSPPVFFKQTDSFRMQLNKYSPKALENILGRLVDLEAKSKRTGTPVETLCGQAFLSLSMMANSEARKRVRI